MKCILIAGSSVLDKDIKFGDLEVDEIYVIFIEDGRSVVTISDKGETIKLAENKLAAIKKAEELVSKLESEYSVSGLSVTFGNVEEEIRHAVEVFNPDVIVAYRNEVEVLIATNVPVVLPRGEIRFENVLYVHSERVNTSWLKNGRKVILTGIVEPVLPPESSSRIMEERRLRLEKEIQEISEEISEPESVEKIVVRGSVRDVVRKLSEMREVDLIMLSRGLGRKKIEDVLKITDKSVMVI